MNFEIATKQSKKYTTNVQDKTLDANCSSWVSMYEGTFAEDPKSPYKVARIVNAHPFAMKQISRNGWIMVRVTDSVQSRTPDYSGDVDTLVWHFAERSSMGMELSLSKNRDGFSLRKGA